MRVLQLISSSGFYGAEAVVVLLSAHLAELSCEVTLGLLHTPGCSQQDLLAAANARGVPVLDLPCAGRFDLQTVLRLAGLLRRRRIDVLHTHGYKANSYGLLAARIARCRLLATCHNWTDRTPALQRYRSWDMRLLRRFDRVVAVSETLATTLREGGVNGSRLEVIRNGIETAAYVRPVHHACAGPILLGAVARLSSEKGIDVLVRALPHILKRRPDARCVVAGEGPERENLRRLAEELGVAQHLVLRGFEKEIASFLASCTVIVQPSHVEGLPMAVLEAMAAARPIVATAVGDVPAVLGHGAAGVLVRPGDPEALADGVLRLLDDEALSERCATNAAAAVRQHFEASGMAQAYLSAYRQLLESTAPALAAPAAPAGWERVP